MDDELGNIPEAALDGATEGEVFETIWLFNPPLSFLFVSFRLFALLGVLLELSFLAKAVPESTTPLIRFWTRSKAVSLSWVSL